MNIYAICDRYEDETDKTQAYELLLLFIWVCEWVSVCVNVIWKLCERACVGKHRTFQNGLKKVILQNLCCEF